jgi:hypothetical protein
MTSEETHDVRAELAALRAELGRQRAAHGQALATLQRRSVRRARRSPIRRVRVALMAALLMALVPLVLLAAGSFTDLDPASPHNANIAAIQAAGITKGCDPPDFTQYCPKDTVTREEMASFLARLGGLGGNPPVANALTAVSAQTAATAATAGTLGGYPANGLARVARGSTVNKIAAGTFTIVQTVSLTAPAPGFVLVTATASADAVGGPACGTCLVAYRLARNGSDFSPVETCNLPPGSQYVGLAITWVFPVAAGEQSFALAASQFPSNVVVDFANPIITALYVPFGPTGNTP